MKYQAFAYNPNLLKPPITRLDSLFRAIKKFLQTDKIIYENKPTPLDSRLTINNSRFINIQYDKMLIFAIGNPSMISTLWYTQYGQNKHLSVCNGRAIIASELFVFDHIVTRHQQNNIFSAIFCDFRHYNIKNFIDSHPNGFRLTDHYSIV